MTAPARARAVAKEHARRPTHGPGPAHPVEAPAATPPAAQPQLLLLQRLAGNRAVAWALQRAPGPDAGEAPPPKKVTGYLGMNPEARKEVVALKGASREELRATTGSAELEEKLKEESGIADFVATDLGVDPVKNPDRHRKAVYVLLGADPRARDTLGELMRWMNQAENGQIVLDRLVLSGHSNGFQLWGDSQRLNARQKPGILIVERDLGNVAAAFPGAAGQVRSIMFSACETVGAVEAVVRLFPNLDSVWAYAGFSPDIGQGSTAHIKTWARATEGGRTPTKAAARGVAAIWTRKDKFIVNDPGAGSIETAYTNAMSDYIGIAGPMLKGEQEISLPTLARVYGRIQDVIHHPAATADQKATATGAMEVVLRLRHWPQVRERFAATHGAELETAYRELELKPPTWASISRKDLVAHLKVLEKAYEAHPAATAAKDTIEHLVHDGLVRLDPSVIPAGGD